MSTLGDIRHQLSQLMDTIKRQEYKLEDVLPAEMQDHFTDLKELKIAREYIKEIEGREQQFKEEKAKLAASVHKNKAQIDDLPENFKALKVDLQQAQHHIAYYQELAENANEQAARDQRKLAEAVKRQTSADEDARKIEKLERELVKHRDAVLKQLEQNRKMTALHEAELEREQVVNNEKQDKINALINYSNRLEVEKTEAVAQAENVSETYDTLVAAMEAESVDAGELLNQHYARSRSNEQLLVALSTQLAPLNRFYYNTFRVLGIYQSLLRDLLDYNCGAPPVIPRDFNATLSAACDNLEGFQELTTAINTAATGLAQEKVRNQVVDMAESATQIYTSLSSIKRDMSTFIDRVGCDTYAWVAVKGRSNKLGKPLSPASSVSSFAAISKRIWSPKTT